MRITIQGRDVTHPDDFDRAIDQAFRGRTPIFSLEDRLLLIVETWEGAEREAAENGGEISYFDLFTFLVAEIRELIGVPVIEIPKEDTRDGMD